MRLVLTKESSFQERSLRRIIARSTAQVSGLSRNAPVSKWRCNWTCDGAKASRGGLLLAQTECGCFRGPILDYAITANLSERSDARTY